MADLDGVIAGIERALAADPANSALRLHLAELPLGQSRHGEALEHYTSAARGDPRNTLAADNARQAARRFANVGAVAMGTWMATRVVATALPESAVTPALVAGFLVTAAVTLRSWWCGASARRGCRRRPGGWWSRSGG